MAGPVLRRALWWTTVLATALVATAAATPSKPPGWLPPRNLSDAAADAAVPSIAVGAAGDVYVVWAQAMGSVWTVQEVERPVGGSWSLPRALSRPAGHVGSPAVVVAGTHVLASWERYDGKNLIAQVAERDAAGDWSAPVSLSPPGHDALAPQIAVDARGDAAVVWASLGLGGWTIQAADRPAGADWRLGSVLDSPAQGAASPEVAFDAAGNAAAVWVATDGAGWGVRGSYRPRAGRWGKVVTISASDATGSLEPQIAMDAGGDALAVWSRSPGESTIVETATRSASTGAWSAPHRLSDPGQSALAPRVAVDARGYGVVLWTSSAKAGLSVGAVYRLPGKRWGPPSTITGIVAGPLAPSVALDERGDALAAWSHSAGGSSRIQSAYLPAGSPSWSAARSISKPGGDALTPQVGVDSAGDGAVAWVRFNGSTFVVQASGYDRTGPVLRLTVPARGAAHRRIVFSVVPKDLWSAVGSVRWAFGDGATGAGLVTGHVYPQPGAYTVQVSARDSFGHVTTARRRVTISAG